MVHIEKNVIEALTETLIVCIYFFKKAWMAASLLNWKFPAYRQNKIK